jgi:hypothetical protein
MDNKIHSGTVIYMLRGSVPRQQHLGLYSTFNDAYDALEDYFDRTLDEDGSGKYLYQFDTYTILSQEVDVPVLFNRHDHWQGVREDYCADYTNGTLKQLPKFKFSL